jgi:hypothetical protein
MEPVDVECHFQLVRMGLCRVEGPSYRLKQHNLSNTGSVYLLCKHWIKTVYDERQRGQTCIVCSVQTSDSLHWRCMMRKKKFSYFSFSLSLFNSFLYSLAYLQARPHSVVWRENKSQEVLFFIPTLVRAERVEASETVYSQVYGPGGGWGGGGWWGVWRDITFVKGIWKREGGSVFFYFVANFVCRARLKTGQVCCSG